MTKHQNNQFARDVPFQQEKLAHNTELTAFFGSAHHAEHACYHGQTLLTAGRLSTGTVIGKGDMQQVMTQHQNNQSAQDVPFMREDKDSSGDEQAEGTGIFDPGHHSQVSCPCLALCSGICPGMCRKQ